MAVAKFCQFCRLKVPFYATVCSHCTRDIDTAEQIQKRLREDNQRRTKFILFLAAIVAVPLFLGQILGALGPTPTKRVQEPTLTERPKEPTLAERNAEKKRQEAAAAAAKAAARPDATYLAGLASLDRGDYDKAIADFTTAIEVDPNDLFFSHLYRATAYEKKGDRNNAIADYRKALALTRDAGMKKEISAALNRLGAKP